MRLPFGKYRGKEFSEIPNNYLAWLIKKDILKEPYRTELRVWLIEEKSEEVIKAWATFNYIDKESPFEDYKEDIFSIY